MRLPYELVKQRVDKHLRMTSILKLSGARQEAYERGCPSYKFLRAMVEKAIRSSKRKFAQDQLNSEKDAKAWWYTVRQITNNATKSAKSHQRTVIKGGRLDKTISRP